MFRPQAAISRRARPLKAALSHGGDIPHGLKLKNKCHRPQKTGQGPADDGACAWSRGPSCCQLAFVSGLAQGRGREPDPAAQHETPPAALCRRRAVPLHGIRVDESLRNEDTYRPSAPAEICPLPGGEQGEFLPTLEPVTPIVSLRACHTSCGNPRRDDRGFQRCTPRRPMPPWL